MGTDSGASVAVVGGGAIGGVWAARLARAGNAVSILDVSPVVVEAIRAEGLVVETSGGGSETVRLTATSRPEQIGHVDVAYFFVKAQHTAAAADLARPLVGPDTTVVTQQNGWGNADVLAGVYPPQRLVVGVTYHSATVAAPGRVRHTATGPSFVGPFVDGGEMAPATRVGALMGAAGLETTATPGVKTEVWKKLILNCATLPTAALTRLTSGGLGDPGPLLEVLDALALEAVAVARALGYAIEPAERLDRIHTLLAGGGGGKASMLQDVEAARKTEIEVVNGAVVREAVRLGLDAPLNRAMVALIGGLERSYVQIAA
ncbi:MAG: 2-dehydropantoate 2-reductase [Chloroflexota bacterium]|nr:2-dehydropantoate 2-reductase [Chloroflexota bacterium]